MPRLTLLPVLAAVAALAVPAGASAADTAAPCTLQAPGVRAEHPIGDTGLVARDPYGGRLTRNRLFFDFSVRGPAAALAGVAKVQWSMDGTVVREDPSVPFEWKGLSGSDRRMPAGDHTITVTVVPKAGAPVSTQFALTATDCQNASFTAEVPPRRGAASMVWDSAFESDAGEPLTGVAIARADNVASALPRALRGRRIGTLTVGTRSYALKGSRTALARGGLKVTFAPGTARFLRVTGLPAGTQHVAVRLVPGVVQVRSRAKAFTLTGALSAASGTVAVPAGGRYV